MGRGSYRAAPDVATQQTLLMRLRDGERTRIVGAVARVDPGGPVKVGKRARFAVNASGMQLFEPNSGAAIWEDLPTN
jgi:hypothetical protein